MAARRRPSPARQWIILLLLILLIVGTAWVAQYVLMRASMRPRLPATALPR